MTTNAKPETAFAEREVQVNGLTLRLVEAGNGPPLVVLPGAGGFARSVAHALLARRLRTVVVEGVPASATARVTGAAISALGTRLGFEAFGVLGIRGGSAAAAWAAVEAAGRIDVLVLTSPTGITLVAPLGARDDGSSWGDAELVERLAELPVAKLVLVGSWDTVLPKDAVSRFRAALPNSHAILVYGAEHAIAESRPQAFADVVSDFVERKDQFVVARESLVINP